MDNIKSTVISTRVRLARNIEGYPFPAHLKNERQAKEIIRLVTSCLSRQDEYRLYYMDGIDGEQAQAFRENHLISPALIKNKRFSGVLMNGDESIVIMINEEDHLREQCIVGGLSLRYAYNTMSDTDNKISSVMKFAFDEQLGYLTACPTNLGTGLRASVMMFLPAITINGMMPKLIDDLSKLGLTVRGIYGEGSQAEGYNYQISNEVTLGVSEEEILDEVEKSVRKVCVLEAAARETLKTCPSALDVKDDCMRSFGILTNCAKLTTGELTRLVANVRLGACLGYIKIEELTKLDDLVVKMRPSNINAAAGRALNPVDRDIYRAQYTARYLGRLVGG